MRRSALISFILMLSMCAVIFTSCAQSNEKIKDNASSQLAGGFKCDASIVWNNTVYEVNLVREAPGLFTMTFVQPKELSSLSFVLDSDGLKVKFGDLSVKVDQSSISETSIFNGILSAFDACLSPAGLNAAQNSDGSVNVSGNGSAGKFTMKLSKDYIPESLTLPDQNMKIDFKNFKFN